MFAPLLAVHIADGVLAPAWLLAGLAGTAALIWLGSRRLPPEEIPRVALMTAVFFIGSTIHIRIGPTSVHLVLNGLLGVVLGIRACLAVPVGLALQALLLQHGGISAWGVNSCVLTLPALLGSGLFQALQRVSMREVPRFLATALSVFAYFATVVTAVYLLVWGSTKAAISQGAGNGEPGTEQLRSGFVALGCVLLLAVVACVAAWIERRWVRGVEFAFGLFVGVATVLSTLVLNGLALDLGGEDDWRKLVLLNFVAHLPVAAAEGLITGVSVAFLARVKPEMLGRQPSPREP